MGRMSRKDSEEALLKKSGQAFLQPDGAFLVRLSESSPGDFSLSVKYRDQVQHFKVLRDNTGKYFLWAAKFNSLNELIKFHKTSSVSRTQQLCLRDMVEEVKKAPKLRVVAKFDFVPQDSEELGFRKGEVINVIEKEDENWWQGELRGAVGLFPVNYVEILNN